MTVTITTTKKAASNGAGNIIATGAGRQRTVRYDHALSSDQNHGFAAGTLALVLGLEWSDGITHEVVGGGNRHRFTF